MNEFRVTVYEICVGCANTGLRRDKRISAETSHVVFILIIPTTSVVAKKHYLEPFASTQVYKLGSFLRRLTIAKKVKPRIMPIMIDSKGNPGTGGNAIGTVTEIELEVLKAVVVGELTTIVTTEVTTVTVGCAAVVVELCEVIVVLLLVELVV